jgi:tryptophan-rich sensory protein
VFNILVFDLLKPLSAALLIPYLLWVSYAGYLNFGIWRLNRELTSAQESNDSIDHSLGRTSGNEDQPKG